jgi:hypothetical protein
VIGESEVVLNLVWTGTTFDHLQVFVLSQLAQCDARFRFVANACPPDQVAKMERFATRFPSRITDVVVASPHQMVRHGDCLELIRTTRDDGPCFALVDVDIIARGPFLAPYLELLDGGAAAATAGKEVWSTTNTRPADHPGVNGEYFFDQDGFVFGSPHFAIYDRAALDAACERWSVGFATAGNDVPDEARAQLAAMGRDYWVYDTAKVVNILLQADGRRLVHVEHPDLLHVGGVSHFLAPPPAVTESGEPTRAAWWQTAEWGEWDGMADRYAVAQFAAAVITATVDGTAPPVLPPGVDPDVASRLDDLSRAIGEAVERYGPLAEP